MAGLIALGSELYIAPRERALLRSDLLDIQEDYFRRYASFIDRMRFASEAEPDGRIVLVKEDVPPIPTVRTVMGAWPKDRSYINVFAHDFKHPDYSGQDIAATPWASRFLVASEKENALSYHVASMQISDDKSSVRFNELRDCVLAWSKHLRPAHGQAGFAAVMEIAGEIGNAPFVYPTMQRYLGLDVHVPVSFIGEAEGVFNRIKCINWLTVLGDAILNELGGLSAARDALEPDCVFYPYPGGVVIQAGEWPCVCDVEQEPIMPKAYHKVAAFTKPVRFTGYRSSLFRVAKPLVAIEEAKKWVSRFD
ncbi:MAG: DUF3396 domain-containing protein [Azoarcus sp.]|nr:DUF3396 domain-containing protein [Azoarcus sp.]